MVIRPRRTCLWGIGGHGVEGSNRTGLLARGFGSRDVAVRPRYDCCATRLKVWLQQYKYHRASHRASLHMDVLAHRQSWVLHFACTYFAVPEQRRTVETLTMV